ncbi:MAG: hypothetical protein K8H88_11150 [Sandaracinaceae bacterium]|nr:hypothetical protein [Sandaracinaceae bacterium]
MLECDIHTGRRTDFLHGDDFCLSVLDPGAQTFTLNIRVMVRVEDPMVVATPDCLIPSGPRMRPQVRTTYTGEPMSAADLTRFKEEFAASIETHWNRKFQLVPLNGDAPPLTCLVKVEFTEQSGEAQMFVRTIKNPTLRTTNRTHGPERRYPNAGRQLRFRACCANVPWGDDMTIDWNGMSWDFLHDVTDAAGNTIRIPQNTVAHEFGHYLGLDHSCHVPSSTAVGWCASPSPDQPDEYCRGTTEEEMNRMMACGNRLVAENGTPWQQRLAAEHHYRCGAGWVPRLVPRP